jgi:signal peptidase I
MLGYNAGIDWNPIQQAPQPRDRDATDSNRWVGDLMLECEVELSADSEVVLELSKGANRFQATFGRGEVKLTRVGPGAQEFGNPTRPCKVREGVHKLRFANVDCRLWVWVDEKRIDFGPSGEYSPVEPTTYDPEDKDKEGWTRANDIEAPAGIGARGQVAAVRHIKLFRDVYYTRSSGDQTEADIYYVQPGHYLCLGDNSAQSSDSRRWGAVPERLMLGKAVFVFFPVGRIGFIK